MNDLSLYLVSVLIWGSTWIAITFQYGRVAPEVSVVYRFALDASLHYLGSLAFLSVFGSILAFGAYLTLVGRIGAGRAGYAMVVIPVVALALSTAMEGLRWHWGLALGAALCLAGNLLVLPGARPRLARA